MPTIKLMFPPFLQIELSDQEIVGYQEALSKATRRLLRLLKITKDDFLGYYFILARHSGKALDVDAWKQEDCANVWQYSLHGGANQQWMLVKAEGNFYYIFSRNSGKVLSVEASSLEDCANVFQYTFNGGDNQKWELRNAEDGYVCIIAKHSGKALDVDGWKQEDFANVWQYSLHGGANQQWMIKPVE